MLNLIPGAKRKLPWESLLRCKNTVDAHARVPFPARDEKNDNDYMEFFSLFGRAENRSPIWRYRAKIFGTGWIPLHVIQDLFQKPARNFSPASRAEI